MINHVVQNTLSSYVTVTSYCRGCGGGGGGEKGGGLASNRIRIGNVPIQPNRHSHNYNSRSGDILCASIMIRNRFR